MPVKIFQLHKRSSYKYANIQDKFAFNEESKLIAIADGTTQSFRSDLWASILTKEFVSKPQFSAEAYLNNIGDSLAKFNAVDFVFSENPALASLEKQKIASGATTTFMGLKFEADAVEILSCGDSNVFILKDNEDIDTYPFNSMDELDNNKSFINTIKYTDLTKEEFYYTKLAISHNDKLIICTDALSRFLLENKNYLQQILQFKTHYEFYQFCIAQWDAKKMQEDDITLVIVEDPANFKTGTFIPAKDFEFEKEKEYEFIPTPINDNDMNDNNNNLIEALRKELHEINGKINKLESIFKFLLIITVVNLAFNFYVSYNSLSTISDKLKEQLKYRTITDPLGTPEKPNKQLPPKELATPPPPPTQPAASTPTATTPPKAPSANNLTAAPVQSAPAKNNPAAPVAAKPAAPAKPATKALPTVAKPAAPAKTVTPAAPAATTKPPSL